MTLISRGLFALLCLFLLSVHSSYASAQDPLFADESVLDIVLRGPFAQIDKDRDKEQEYPGTLSYADAEGAEVTLDVKYSVRGNFRLRKNVCKHAQLWVNLKKSQVKGTLFAKQDKLKLVVQCQKSERYAEYIAREQQVYSMFQLLSEISLDTRLLNVEYVDTEKGKPRSASGFFIQHQNRLAKQHDMAVLKEPKAKKAMLDPNQSALVALFMYMVSNTDYSMIASPPGENCCHNIKELEAEGGTLYPVPYDFDSTGFINASYAEPSGNLGQKNVRQRIYRGYCLPEEPTAYARALLQEKRSEISAIVNDPRFVSEKSMRKGGKYIDDFYKIIDDEKKYQREVIGKCR